MSNKAIRQQIRAELPGLIARYHQGELTYGQVWERVEELQAGLEPDRWWHHPVGLILLPVTFALILLMAALWIPVCAVMAFRQSIQEARFRRQMQERGRRQQWPLIEPRLVAGEGALIIEQAQKMPVRLWWTADNVLQLAPKQPPEPEHLDVLLQFAPHPFVRWCHDRYTDPQAGTAILIEPPFRLPPGLWFASFFKERYPRLVAIDTVYCRTHDRDANRSAV
jgi:hypothetical protein